VASDAVQRIEEAAYRRWCAQHAVTCASTAHTSHERRSGATAHERHSATLQLTTAPTQTHVLTSCARRGHQRDGALSDADVQATNGLRDARDERVP
jgi:hypothetical protein